MELIATNQIANFTFNHYSGANREVVSISIDGEFWDSIDFDSYSQAVAFMADPLAEQRKRNLLREARGAERIAESDAMAERNASLIGCNRGRQVGPNKRGSI